jgi:hypothetical protein
MKTLSQFDVKCFDNFSASDNLEFNRKIRVWGHFRKPHINSIHPPPIRAVRINAGKTAGNCFGRNNAAPGSGNGKFVTARGRSADVPDMRFEVHGEQRRVGFPIPDYVVGWREVAVGNDITPGNTRRSRNKAHNSGYTNNYLFHNKYIIGYVGDIKKSDIKERLDI